MSVEMAPAQVEYVLEKGGLVLYSSKITPARGGPLLHLGAHYAHLKEGWEPLSKEESTTLLRWITSTLERNGYKVRGSVFSHNGEEDVNDFRFKILLKPEDIDPELYERIKEALRGRKTRAKEPRTLREAFE